MKSQRKARKSRKMSKKRYTWVIPAARRTQPGFAASNCDCTK